MAAVFKAKAIKHTVKSGDKVYDYILIHLPSRVVKSLDIKPGDSLILSITKEGEG